MLANHLICSSEVVLQEEEVEHMHARIAVPVGIPAVYGSLLATQL